MLNIYNFFSVIYVELPSKRGGKPAVTPLGDTAWDNGGLVSELRNKGPANRRDSSIVMIFKKSFMEFH